VAASAPGMRCQKPNRERASDTNTIEELTYVEKTSGDNFDHGCVRRHGFGAEHEFLDHRSSDDVALDAHAHSCHAVAKAGNESAPGAKLTSS
jgi:hypothetical protein